MGDPFSAAGTAVGITSLGIQTCQIIHKYYSDFDGYHDDIDSVLRQAEGLKGILESLRALADRLQIEDNAPISQLQRALNACEDALHALKRMADKCAVAKQAQGMEARLREARKRVLWPYKKETIADLQAKLNAFKSNLNLALQSAGLDGMLRKLDELNPAIDVIQDHTADIKQDLAGHTGMLSGLQTGLADAALVRQQHHNTLSNQLSELQIQSMQDFAAMKEELGLVASALTSFRDPATIPPSLLRHLMRQLNDVRCQASGSLMDQQQSNLYTPSSVSQLLCNCRPKNKQLFRSRRGFAHFSEETFKHRSICPYATCGDQSRTVAAQFTVCTWLVSFCVQAGWQRSRRGGWNSIAPILRYRAVVPSGTGAFKILEDAQNHIQDYRISMITQELLIDKVTTTTITLQRAYQTYASPYDIDEHGLSLLHKALSMLEAAIVHGLKDSSTIRGLLDVCQTSDMASFSSHAGKVTPIESWQESMAYTYDFSWYGVSKEVNEDVLRYLVERSGDWSIYDRPYNDDWPMRARWPGVQFFYDSIAAVLASENVISYFDEDNPLCLAILRRCEADFEKCLSKTVTSHLISLLDKWSNAKALVAWSRGMEILNLLGFLKNCDALVDLLWAHVVQIQSLKTLEVLIDHKKSVTPKEWNDFNHLNHHQARWKSEEPVRMGVISVEETQWTGIFDVLAAKLRTNNMTDSSLIDVSLTQATTSTLFPYHIDQLTIPGCEGAWKAGYRDLNALHECDEWLARWGKTLFPQDPVTPLWIVSLPRYGLYDRQDLNVGKWLVNHGADPFWIHPRFLTTPAHNLVRGVRDEAWVYPDSTLLSSFGQFLASRVCDMCTCFCSTTGCYCIGCALSKRLGASQRHHEIICPYIFDIVDRHKDELWMSAAVVRTMTFDRLSLTHTCCYFMFDELRGTFQRPTSEERGLIHEDEQEDINLLETLVVEFETKWATYNKPFVTFMNRVWKKRMRQIKRDRQVYYDTNHAKMLKIGVILEKPIEYESDGDWPDDYESEDEREGWYTTDEESEGQDGDEGT